METSVIWKYLDNVWIVTGLVLIILLSLLSMLSKNGMNNRKKKQQMHKGLNYLFVLGLTGMFLATLVSQKNNPTSFQQADTNLLDSSSFASQDYIDAKSQSIGDVSNTGGNTSINQLFHMLPDRTRSERPSMVNQHSKDNHATTINYDEDSYFEVENGAGR